MPVPEKDDEDSPYSRHLVTDYAEDWFLNAPVVKLRTTVLGVSGARPNVGPPVSGLRTWLTLAEFTGTDETLTYPTMSPGSTCTRMGSLQSQGASPPVASELLPQGACQPVAFQLQAVQPQGISQPVVSQSLALHPQGASQPVAFQLQAAQPQGISQSVASQSQALQPQGASQPQGAFQLQASWPQGTSQSVASQELQPLGTSQPASQSQSLWPQGASQLVVSLTQVLQPRGDRWSVASQSPGHMSGATQRTDPQTISESTPDQQA